MFVCVCTAVSMGWGDMSGHLCSDVTASGNIVCYRMVAKTFYCTA